MLPEDLLCYQEIRSMRLLLLLELLLLFYNAIFKVSKAFICILLAIY
jgi:hypothetical protein